MKRRQMFWLTLLLTAAASAWAQEGVPPAVAAPASVNWSSMSQPQQKLLESFHDRWDALPPVRQQALSNGASRWLQMTPEQREGARGRFRNWRNVPPEQQMLIRQRWQRFQQLAPEEQQAVRQNYRAFSGLPPEQRARLRERWLNATPQQRAQMLQNQRIRRGMGGPGFRRFPPPLGERGR